MHMLLQLNFRRPCASLAVAWLELISEYSTTSSRPSLLHTHVPSPLCTILMQLLQRQPNIWHSGQRLAAHRANTPTFSVGEAFASVRAPRSAPCRMHAPRNSGSPRRAAALSTEQQSTQRTPRDRMCRSAPDVCRARYTPPLPSGAVAICTAAPLTPAAWCAGRPSRPHCADAACGHAPC